MSRQFERAQYTEILIGPKKDISTGIVEIIPGSKRTFFYPHLKKGFAVNGGPVNSDMLKAAMGDPDKGCKVSMTGQPLKMNVTGGMEILGYQTIETTTTSETGTTKRILKVYFASGLACMAIATSSQTFDTQGRPTAVSITWPAKIEVSPPPETFRMPPGAEQADPADVIKASIPFEGKANNKSQTQIDAQIKEYFDKQGDRIRQYSAAWKERGDH